MKYIKIGLLVLAGVCILPGEGWSQSDKSSEARGFGIRTGYGTNPDGFVIGAQAILGSPLRFMRFAPSFDAGFGDGISSFLFNADFHVLNVSPPGSPAGLYAGLGASLAALSAGSAGSDTEVGLNLVTGLTFPMGSRNNYNLEVRFGVADMPDLRVLFGIMLGSRAKPTTQTIEFRR